VTTEDQTNAYQSEGEIYANKTPKQQRAFRTLYSTKSVCDAAGMQICVGIIDSA
jgi:hypothetical protein